MHVMDNAKLNTKRNLNILNIVIIKNLYFFLRKKYLCLFLKYNYARY